MKRLFAILLAALMALSGGALAEWAGEFPTVTVTGTLTIDLEAARDFLEAAGIDPARLGAWEALLTALNGSSDRLVIADMGIQYDLRTGDGAPLTLAGERDGALTRIVCTLFPNYILTRNAGTEWEDAVSASGTVVALTEKTIDAAASAMTMGVPEMGEYDINGDRFTMRIPLEVDEDAMARAGVEVAQGLRDAGLPVGEYHPGELPVVSAWRYNADGLSATLYTAEIVPAEAEPVSVSVRIDNGEVGVQIDVPEWELSCKGNYHTTENGAGLWMEAAYGTLNIGVETVVETGDLATMTTRLYLNGAPDPVATEVNTFAMGGIRDLTIDDADRTTLRLEDVLTNVDGAGNRLLTDMMFNGLSAFTSHIR